MRMKKLFVSVFVLLAMFIILVSMSGCSGDSDGGGSGGDDWYVDRLITSFPITYETDGYYKDYIIEHLNELFSSDGRYGGYINLPSGMISHGPAYYRDEIEVIHIANGNTIELYEGYLYKYGSSGTSGKTLLYKVSGSSLGEVGYYASSPTYYNYTREGNVITVTQGNVKSTMTVTNDGLLENGGGKWTKFRLGYTYTDNNSDDSGVSEAVSEARRVSKTASVVGDPTFHTAVIKCEFGSSSILDKVNYSKVLAFSKNRSDLENADELARRYHKYDGGREVTYPKVYGPDFNTIYAQSRDNGYIADGDLRLADGNTGDLSNFTAVYDEEDVTFYFCPMIAVANTVVTGEIKSVELKKLKETSGYVDLGLSCMWAASNYKTSSPFDVGYKYTISDNLRKKVGDEGRLPTKAEIEELNKCKIEVVENGLLITGLNGNQIYLPHRTKDGLGISGYGISDIQGYSGTDQYDMIFYYDSSTRKFKCKKVGTPFYQANIDYKWGHQDAYIRAVKNGGGSSGNSQDELYSNLIKKMLKTPLMLDGVDITKTLYNSLCSALSGKYAFDSGCYGEPDYYAWISVTADKNPSLSINYRNLNFTNLWLSETTKGSSSTTDFYYEFHINASDLQDPLTLARILEKDFNNANIPIKLNTSESSASFYFSSYDYNYSTYDFVDTYYPKGLTSELDFEFGFWWGKPKDEQYWIFQINGKYKRYQYY